MIRSPTPERKRLERFGTGVAPVVKMGRPAHCPYLRRSLPFCALGDANRGAYLALQPRGKHVRSGARNRAALKAFSASGSRRAVIRLMPKRHCSSELSGLSFAP